MKNLIKFVAILSVATVAVGAFAQESAPAQGGGGGGRQGGGGGGGQFRRMGGAQSPAMMAFRHDVQDDLKLTTDEKDKLQAYQDKMRTDMRARFQNGGGQRPSREEMQAMMKKSMDDTTAAVNAILTPAQQTRLLQIYVQTAGMQSVTDAGVQKSIGFTAAQKTKLDQYVKDQQAANMELMGNRDLSQDDRTAKFENNKKALDGAIEKLLTEDQKKKLKDLEGPKFTPEI